MKIAFAVFKMKEQMPKGFSIVQCVSVASNGKTRSNGTIRTISGKPKTCKNLSTIQDRGDVVKTKHGDGDKKDSEIELV